MRQLFIALALLFLAGAAHAYVSPPVDVPISITNNTGSQPFTALHTYFMSPTGSDGNSGADAAHPWASPNHAVVCGDVIVAAAGAYSGANFQTWGAVSSCPSGSGGIDGAGGIYFVTLLCGGASVGDCSVTDSSHYAVFDVNRNNWAIEGWKVTSAASSGGQNTAFLADGRLGGPNSPILHHIAFINDISYASGMAFAMGEGGTPHGAPGNGVDEFAVVGDIAQDSASWTLCIAAIDDAGPATFDTNPGTHVIFAGNFSINNQQEWGCPYDGESMFFDTWEAHNYQGQGVMYDNIMFMSEREGIRIYSQTSAVGNYTNPSVMRIFNNTAYDLSLQTHTSNAFSLGNIDPAVSNGTGFYWPTAIFNNIALTQSATNAAGTALYALQIQGVNSSNLVVGGTGIENIFLGFETSCVGGAHCDGTFSTRADASLAAIGTNFYVNPNFKNAADVVNNHAGVPNCSGFADVAACMGWNNGTQTATASSVIDDLTATCANCGGKGYQPPGACVNSGERFNDYPAYLKGIVYLHWDGAALTERSGLVTKPCGM